LRTLWKTKIAGIFLILLLAVSGCSNNAQPTTATPAKVEETKQTAPQEPQTTTPTKDTTTSSSDSTQPSSTSTPAPSPAPSTTPVVTSAPAPAPTLTTPTPAPSTPSVVTPPPAPIQTPQAVTVYITNKGKKYHRDGCRYLSESRIPIRLSDAKNQGYGPCSVCNPPQ